MNDQLKEIVNIIYRVPWSEVETVVISMCEPSKVETYVQQLSKESGWRERVTAAKIINVYNLNQYIPNLIKTFSINPENYTCNAFCEMIIRSNCEEYLIYLDSMKKVCPQSDYGEHLQSRIDETIRTKL